MARFYGNLQGHRGEATRMGTPNSGITAHIRGWNTGILVACRVDADGNDVCTAYETGGSSNPSTIGKSIKVKARRRK